jgi:tRNA dimethylallyltransferase
LAKYYKTVILSADSRQFYNELNIGTAKPTPNQLREVKHFFIDNKSINELYGAGHFEKDAVKLLEDLFKSHSIVFVVGGSGLYIDALLKGVDDFEEVPAEIRNKLNTEYEDKGLGWLQEKVKEVDPVYYESVDIRNPQRLIRALEIHKFTNKPYSSFLSKPKAQRYFTPIKILINLERKELYNRIDKRVDDMMAAGLLDEVKQLINYRNHNALKTVGYKELFEFLDDKSKLEDAVKKIKQHTRNYAKRQITWFKNRDVFEEFGPEDREKIITYIDSFLKHG